MAESTFLHFLENYVRIRGFTDQRLAAHGGMIVWSHFLHPQGFRKQLRAVLPHCPSSPNAYDPSDVALGYMGGILSGADKLSRVAWLQSDAAISEVLGSKPSPANRPSAAFLTCLAKRPATS